MNYRWVTTLGAIILGGWLSSTYSACSPATEPVRPEPQTVVLEYLTLINQGAWDEAKALCTAAQQTHLDALQALMSSTGDSLTADKNALEIVTIFCQQRVDTAWCTTQEKDEFERYQNEYRLRYSTTHDNWLVDFLPTPAEEAHYTEPLPDSLRNVTD